jgi:hypothetical protein
MNIMKNRVPMTDAVVYHFTDTIRLPWILESCDLQPNATCIDGFPPDFLWATTNETGDRSSSAAADKILKLWRDGELQLVRFVLKATDFGDWEEAAKRSGWSEGHIKALKKAAHQLGERKPSNWRSRSVALPISNALRIEAKSYRRGRWTPLDVNRESCITSESDPNFRGVILEDQVYCATRKLTSFGNSYQSIRRLAAQ